jgi:membrane protease YdiL (CAAX protease family)
VPEPQWATFVGLTAVILTLLLALARLSQSMVREDHTPPGRLAKLEDATPSDSPADESPASPDATEPDDPTATTGTTPLELSDPASALDARDLTLPEREPRDLGQSPQESGQSRPQPDDATAQTGSRGVERQGDVTESPGALTAEELAEDPFADEPARPRGPAERQIAAEPETTITLSTGALLANVALTQGVFGVLLLGAVFYTQIPLSAFGVTADPLSTGLPALAVGIGLGVALYVANEVGGAVADTMGVEYDERLRSMLAPESAGGWALLFLGVLPVIAGVEELIFRAAVIGATTAGFGTSPWALAVISSLAFALGHGAQGRVGIVVTGGLGFVLAAAFIVTGSFLVVFVAHYMVNALEFLVHELLDVEWTGESE